jgi:hypothetical protein
LQALKAAEQLIVEPVVVTRPSVVGGLAVVWVS